MACVPKRWRRWSRWKPPAYGAATGVATAALADRLAVALWLATAGVPVPETRAVDTWAEVHAAARVGPVVVKSRNGQVGRGAGVEIIRDGRPPPAGAIDGPWVVQELVAGDGRDHKLYVAGPHIRGLLKATIAADVATHRSGTLRPEVFRPSSDLAELAVRAGAALGLDVYGVDFVLGAEGPRVIDVNPFPGFRGVRDAAALVARHLLSLVGPAAPSAVDARQTE